MTPTQASAKNKFPAAMPALSRRDFFANLAVPAIAARTGVREPNADEEFIVIDGWVLSRDDLNIGPFGRRAR